MSIILYLLYVLQLNILCRSECLVSNCINSQRKHKYKHIIKPRKHKQKQKSKGYLSSTNWNIIMYKSECFVIFKSLPLAIMSELYSVLKSNSIKVTPDTFWQWINLRRECVCVPLTTTKSPDTMKFAFPSLQKYTPSVNPLGCMQSNVLSHDNPNNHLSPHPTQNIRFRNCMIKSHNTLYIPVKNIAKPLQYSVCFVQNNQALLPLKPVWSPQQTDHIYLYISYICPFA